MIDNLHALIDALRDELQQYGEMLALLDQQQERVLMRAADELLETVGSINAQGGVIQAARQKRDACRRRLASDLAVAEDAPFSELLALLPEDYRPLIQALVQENNELLVRVQQRARQNHVLLSRSLELMQRFLSSLFPSAPTATYRGNGTMQPAALPLRPLYEAVV